MIHTNKTTQKEENYLFWKKKSTKNKNTTKTFFEKNLNTEKQKQTNKNKEGKQ